MVSVEFERIVPRKHEQEVSGIQYHLHDVSGINIASLSKISTTPEDGTFYEFIINSTVIIAVYYVFGDITSDMIRREGSKLMGLLKHSWENQKEE